MTIQRGPASTPATPSGGDHEQLDTVNKVGSNNFNEKFRENFYANRIRRDVEPVSIVLPATSLNNDILYVQSILPELPQESGIAYIYPDSVNIRENRQTSFVVPETTTAALKETDLTERLENKDELSVNNQAITEAKPVDNTAKPERSASTFEDEAATELELIADTTTTTTATTATTTEGSIEDKPEENVAETEVDAEKSSTEEDEIISVSVSKSMSEAFSIPEVVTGIVEFFTSTFAPATSEPGNGDSEPTTEQAVKLEAESTTATTTTTTTASKTDKGRSNIFTGKRAHPFLASKTSSQASTTESAAPASSTSTPARKPFFRQKTLADLNSSTGEQSKKNKTEASEPQISNEIAKPEKKNNLLNNARPRFNILAKKLSVENETTTTTTTTVSTPEEAVSTEDSIALVSDAPVEVHEEVKEEAAVKEVEDVADENQIEVDTKEAPEPKVEAKTSSPILTKNKLRPKFQVPKSLQGRLLDQVVVEKEDKNEVTEKIADKKPAKEFKATTSAPKTRSPLRLRQQSRFSAPPATPTELPVVIQSISPRSRNRIRPDRPLDLSPSPSQTVTRTRPSSSSFKSRVSEDVTDITTAATKAFDEPTTTEKITVAKVLATLHGEQEPETEASTLRPHSFKPKLGSASRDKLREKLREHLAPEDHLEGGEIFEDDHHESSAQQKQKENRSEERPAPKISAAPEFNPSSANSGQVRRVARPRPNKQELKINPVEEEKPRSAAEPILTAPRRRQRPQPGTKIKPEHSAENVQAPTGGRLLSDADLMTGLGFNKKEEPEEKVFEFIPTPSAPLIEAEEEEIHSDLEDELNLDEDKEDLPIDEPKAEKPFAGPYIPTIEDILKSAIVDSNVPIAKDIVLESSTSATIPAPEVLDTVVLPPAPEVSLDKVVASKKTPLRSRAQLPLRHRLESGHQNQESVPSSAGPQSNLIESKRVRSRQRVAVIPANATPIEVDFEKSEPKQQEASVPTQNTRQVTRVRKPIRTQTTRVSQVNNEATVSSPRSRGNSNNNNRPITRVNNNRLRVRGGSRSTTAIPDIVVITEENKALDDGELTLTGDSNAPVLQEDTNEVFVPDYDIGNIIGKFELNEGHTNDNTDSPQEVLSNEDEEGSLYQLSNELGKEEFEEEKKEEFEEEKKEEIVKELELVTETNLEETSSVRNFQPKFGQKQRQSVRSKLKSHLFEQAPSSTESFIEIKESEIEEDNTKQNEEKSVEQVPQEQFQSVSPSEGLSAIPASFFTTTSRFGLLPGSGFLPTQKPQTRVGRSTVGYRNTVNDVTDKPGLFSKVGISEHSVRDELVVTTTPTTDFTTTTLLDEVLPTTTNENSVAIDDIPVEVGNRLYKRKKVDLLSKLSEKVTDREEKERKLLNSFAESHTRITTKFPVDNKLISLSTTNPEESTSKTPALSSFLRPRRKFELGFKDLKPTIVESSTLKPEENFENSTQIGDNENTETITTTAARIEIDTASTTVLSNITEPVADSLSLLPTPRPFPKDLKLPFGKKNNDRFKPILLSFTVEKKPVRQNVTKSEESGNNSNSTASLSETTTTTTAVTLDVESLDSEPSASASKISSLKKKFQFGRKAFGKLAGPKGSAPESSSPPPTPSPSSTSSPTTLSSIPDPNAPDVLLVPGNSEKVF